MLKVKNVVKTFGDIVALQETSFDVAKGEFIFVVGPSGSGKTTLIKLILKQLIPDTGKIIFNKTDIASLSEKDLPFFRQKIGVVYQDFKVLPERTTRENLEVALAVLEVDEKEWKSRVDNVLELVGLQDRSELFPAQLSGGELQRVSLARALIINPVLILADEPTGNLDWDTAFGMMELLEKINKEGKTIIMATHHREIVDKLKKKVVELKKPEPKKSKKEIKKKAAK